MLRAIATIELDPATREAFLAEFRKIVSPGGAGVASGATG